MLISGMYSRYFIQVSQLMELIEVKEVIYTLCYPITTSSTIISTKPMAKPMVLRLLCSRGSVIPLWIEQIRSGNPITLTEPKMTRFIMSLEEAVDLVLFAFENGHNGDILVQKAPAVCPVCQHAQSYFEVEAKNY